MMYLWTAIGAVLLLAVIGWATMNNRQSKRDYKRTEDATRQLYKEQDRQDKAGENSRDDR